MKSIRTIPLTYNKVINTTIPKRHTPLGLTAQISEHSASVKPLYTYVHDDAFPQLTQISLFLARGQCDLDHPAVQSFDEPLGLTYDANRRTSNIATLWKVTPKIPEEILPPAPPPRPRMDYSSPESREAIEAAEKRLQAQKEFEDTPAVDKPTPTPAPDEPPQSAFEAAIAALPEEEEN